MLFAVPTPLTEAYHGLQALSELVRFHCVLAFFGARFISWLGSVVDSLFCRIRKRDTLYFSTV